MAGKTPYKPGDEFPDTRKRIVEYVGQHKKNRVSLWMWECMDCGARHGPSRTGTITRKDRLSSCCRKYLSGNGNANWKGHEEISGSFLYQYRNDARKRGRPFDVSVEYLWELWLLQDGRCAYTFLSLEHGKTASIDRIDSDLGYVVGNVQWVHRDVNRMKSDFPQDYFLSMCRLIAQNL